MCNVALIYMHCSNPCRGRRGVQESQCQWGSRPLLMWPAADGKKLFMWCEDFVLRDRGLLPEGRLSNNGGKHFHLGPSNNGTKVTS